MISITRQFEWDMGHRVTNHMSLCKNPHGHRYRLLIEISGDIKNKNDKPDQGMVLDFGDLKGLINEEIVDKLDHSFMYWDKDDVMSDFAKNNKELKFIKTSFVPTAECIVGYIAITLQKLFENKLPGIALESATLFETPNCSAKWSRD